MPVPLPTRLRRQAKRAEGPRSKRPKSQRAEMSFETISLMLNWLQMGVLLAILFRISHTYELIASTQRELRRAIHRLGERRPAERGTIDPSGTTGITQHAKVEYESIIGARDLAGVSPGVSR